MRTAVHRDDPRVVIHLEQQDHVVRRLHDLHVVVVAARLERWSGAEPEQAALRQPAILRIIVADTIGAHPDRIAAGRLVRGGFLLRLGRHRRNLAVRRVDDERSLLQGGARARSVQAS